MKSNAFLVLFASVVAMSYAYAAPPESIEAGLDRINQTLGRGEQAGPWRFPIELEWENRPDTDAKPVVVVASGAETYSTPYRIAGAIVFDGISQWTTKVYDVGDDGKRTVSREDSSHNALRYSLRLRDSRWYFDSRMVMHSKTEYLETPYHRGTVLWHKDGFELKGIAGLDQSYGSGGKLIPVVNYESRRFTRDGGQLLIRRKMQGYQLLTRPEGETLPLPDFDKPQGRPFEEEQRSGGK